MKELTLESMHSISGEASGRGCMIAGGMALLTAIGGIFAPPVWGATAAITSAAALSGCFD